jgi:hypothetical protein
MIKKSLILGKGEVGQALFKVLKPFHNIQIREQNNLRERFDVIHICFPYFKGFEKEVKRYQELYCPKFTIIHSTVPIGTSIKCNAFHSPIRGTRPYLEKSLTTFVKYLAPKNIELKRYFEKAWIQIKILQNSKDSEALKIWSTTQYALSIMIEKEIFQFCKERKLDFKEVYTDANQTYDEGYFKLGNYNVQRPVLKHVKGQIGGHCIINNLKFLDHWLSNLIKKHNKKYDN